MSKKHIKIDNTRKYVQDKIKEALDKKPSTSSLSNKGITINEFKMGLDTQKGALVPRSKRIQGTNRRSRDRRPATALMHTDPISAPVSNDTILITGGFGDVIQLESHFSDELREKVHTILYATSRWKGISEMFEAFSSFPNVKRQVCLWDDWKSQFDFVSKYQLMNKLGPSSSESLKNSEDWSISLKFRQIDLKHLQFTGSSLLEVETDVKRFSLPEEYFVVCPFTKDKRLKNRDFDSNDWKQTESILEKKGIKGVIINHGEDQIYRSQKFIDLSNETNFLEAAEIIKNSQGYIGIDTCWSTLASQLFEFPNIMVKSVNKQCFAERHIYFAPQSKFSFMGKSIFEIAQRL